MVAGMCSAGEVRRRYLVIGGMAVWWAELLSHSALVDYKGCQMNFKAQTMYLASPADDIAVLL